MSNTIQIKVSSVNDHQKTTKLLRKIGFNFDQDESLLKTVFTIQLKENIEILDLIKEAGFFYNKKEIWDLFDFTEYGITLYIAHSEADGMIFIPKENIVSIYCVDFEDLDREEEMSPENKRDGMTPNVSLLSSTNCCFNSLQKPIL